MYLLDLAWLREITRDPDRLTGKRLIDVACMPFRQGLFDEARLEAHADLIDQPKACAEP
jgi:hypothetical protein